MKNIKCPNRDNKKIWKLGKNKGKQQYKCKECGRIMRISRHTVYNWIKQIDSKIYMKVKFLQINELLNK